MTALIAATGLSRVYSGRGGEMVALDGVDLDLDRGVFVVIAGPSGCGKTTLLNLLGLLDRGSAGRLALDGAAVEALSPTAFAALRRDRVGFLFQDAGLIARMSVVENVVLPLDYRGLPRKQALSRARAALDRVGLLGLADHSVDTLSGGERQRAGLARILAAGPDLIICDEPTASLDEANSLSVVSALVALARDGALVVCASHDPIVMDRADIAVVMERGRIVAVERRA